MTGKKFIPFLSHDLWLNSSVNNDYVNMTPENGEIMVKFNMVVGK